MTNIVTIHIKNAPAGLWQRMRVEAVKRNLTIKAVVLLALEEWLNLNETRGDHE